MRGQAGECEVALADGCDEGLSCTRRYYTPLPPSRALLPNGFSSISACIFVVCACLFPGLGALYCSFASTANRVHERWEREGSSRRAGVSGVSSRHRRCGLLAAAWACWVR